MERKSSTHNVRCLHVFSANWKCPMSKSECLDESEFHFSIVRSFRKTAVEYDWFSKIYQLPTKLFLREKTMGWWVSFGKITWISFKNGKGDEFAVVCVSNDNNSWKYFFRLNCVLFCKKARNFINFEKLENIRRIFLKNVCISLESFETKLEGYAAGSIALPSCMLQKFFDEVREPLLQKLKLREANTTKHYLARFCSIYWCIHSAIFQGRPKAHRNNCVVAS